MYGPDRCGSTSKTHLIIRHKNPISGEIEEKHLVAPPPPQITKTTALYTLIIRPDQTYEIRINDSKVKSGSLLEDFNPPFNPPTEIDDPEDVKPADWVETPKISDPNAVKPAEWDEDAPAMIADPDAEKPADWLDDEPAVVPDPDAEKPEEWSDEDDGDWIAPMVPNPACEAASGCGEWTRPEIPNREFATWLRSDLSLAVRDSDQSVARNHSRLQGQVVRSADRQPRLQGPVVAAQDSVRLFYSPTRSCRSSLTPVCTLDRNPNYYHDDSPADLSPIAGLGFELWSMTDSILFDNIFLSSSEADLERFLDETYRVKAPLEAAAEAADKPAESEHKHSGAARDAGEPDVKSDPVAWVKFKAQQFLDEALVDPKKAFVDRPLTGGVFGVVFATLIGMVGVILSLILPAPPVQKAAKQAATKAQAAAEHVKDQAAPVVEQVKEAAAPVAEAGKKKVEEVAEGVRTRAGKAKAAAQEKQ